MKWGKARLTSKEHAAKALQPILEAIDVPDQVKQIRQERLLCEPAFVKRAKQNSEGAIKSKGKTDE
ncbi:hypothetical protein CHELA1G11_12444 [Hyphomicrobiales bacterium]|nr:hypothetical protein CHELA1G2_11862 [Hyphomicrobiales bacterium]CAH1664878.1 hypothetical protein CHELA1G11_12444 [Hyphomicrobiales bacterium]